MQYVESHDVYSSSRSNSHLTQGRKGVGVQSITPVNIGQILNAAQEHSDDAFRIDGKQINTVPVFYYYCNNIVVSRETYRLCFIYRAKQSCIFVAL